MSNRLRRMVDAGSVEVMAGTPIGNATRVGPTGGGQDHLGVGLPRLSGGKLSGSTGQPRAINMTLWGSVALPMPGRQRAEVELHQPCLFALHC